MAGVDSGSESERQRGTEGEREREVCKCGERWTQRPRKSYPSFHPQLSVHASAPGCPLLRRNSAHKSVQLRCEQVVGTVPLQKLRIPSQVGRRVLAPAPHLHVESCQLLHVRACMLLSEAHVVEHRAAQAPPHDTEVGRQCIQDVPVHAIA